MNASLTTVWKDFLLGWLLAVLLWVLMRNTDIATAEWLATPWSVRVLVMFLIWISQALFYGFLYWVVSRFVFGRVSFKRLLAISLLAQFLAAIMVVSALYGVLLALDLTDDITSIWEFLALPSIKVGFVYALAVNACIALVVHLSKLIGHGNLLKLIRGAFYTPQATVQLFMFLDLRGSTTIAEQLGHLRFSRFIQDCFYDLAVVHRYKATIYRYVGDEAILTWDQRKGMQGANCLKAFFAFQQRLLKRSKHYEKQYGIQPVFKAGLHLGEVTVSEVGEFKREITYLGDTVNTAARIQGECNRLDALLLISEQVVEQLGAVRGFQTTYKGDILLRGKEQTVRLHAVEAAHKPRNRGKKP